MKEGDEVFCIRNFSIDIPYYFKKGKNFEIGKKYFINGFHYDTTISILPGPTYFFYYNLSKKHIYSGKPNRKYPKFENYFTSYIKQLIKIKLDKINKRVI